MNFVSNVLEAYFTFIYKAHTKKFLVLKWTSNMSNLDGQGPALGALEEKHIFVESRDKKFPKYIALILFHKEVIA